MKTLTNGLLKTIETEAIYGNIDDNGNKTYNTIKELSKKYDVSYDYLRQNASKGKWLAKRKGHITKVTQKVEEKKSEMDASLIVQSDDKFMDTGEKARQLAEMKIEENIALLKSGKKVTGYDIKNCVDALKTAQEVCKVAQGEITNRIKVEGGLNGFAQSIREGLTE